MNQINQRHFPRNHSGEPGSITLTLADSRATQATAKRAVQLSSSRTKIMNQRRVLWNHSGRLGDIALATPGPRQATARRAVQLFTLAD